jgi:hypothetical protein
MGILATKTERFDRYERMPVYTVNLWCPETKQGHGIQIPSWLYDNAEQVANEVHQLACKYRHWEWSDLIPLLDCAVVFGSPDLGE